MRQHRAAHDDGVVRTTLNLADDVAEAARALAHAERRSLGDVVSELARRGLTPVPARVANDDGLPVFAMPADAAPITGGMVRRALDEP
jgi:hypothetical protein